MVTLAGVVVSSLLVNHHGVFMGENRVLIFHLLSDVTPTFTKAGVAGGKVLGIHWHITPRRRV